VEAFIPALFQREKEESGFSVFFVCFVASLLLNPRGSV
jgi:hypothetical protein